jgi:hypothetical protein
MHSHEALPDLYEYLSQLHRNSLLQVESIALSLKFRLSAEVSLVTYRSPIDLG